MASSTDAANMERSCWKILTGAAKLNGSHTSSRENLAVYIVGV
jgi:hypothetical protein